MTLWEKWVGSSSDDDDSIETDDDLEIIN